MQDFDLYIRQGAYLPHWTKDGAVYHVRFRLADSLPQEKLKALSAERRELLEKIEKDGRRPTKSESQRIDELFSENMERFLDSGYGECWLKRNDIAKVVADSIKHFDDERYKLYAWCIMPNHVHIVVQPLGDCQLSDIVHSWKLFTARKSNELIGRTGIFWQREYFDHIIRKDEYMEAVVDYVWGNPDEAGLTNWSWRWKIVN